MQDMMDMTIPADETAQAVQSGDTAAQTANPAQTAAAEEVHTTEAETAASVEQISPPDTHEMMTYLPVYNGEVRPIRADSQQEITTLLQLGMKQRDFLPQYERLTRLAADNGDASVKALIDRLCDTAEQERLEKAVATYGEEDGKRFYEMEREQRSRRYEEMTREQESRQQTATRDTAQRLADEFVHLQQTYPEYRDIRDLPREVIECAVIEGISLLDAQNRFAVAEQKRREQSAVHAREASDSTTGSLSQNGDQPHSALDAFVSGLYSRQ